MSKKLQELMNDIFSNVQYNKTCHKRYIKKLTKVFQQYDLNIFFQEFVSCLRVPLSFLQQDMAIENTLQFAAKFAIGCYLSPDGDTTEHMGPFLEKLFDFLLSHHNAKDATIRFGICRFLNMLLNSMGENASIDDALCDKITVSMMDRLLDKSHKVRAQAVFALHRLQDPLNESCPIIKLYIFHLCKDPKVEVRKAILKCMAKNQKTLHAALQRIRDVNDRVRKMAYEFISKVTIKSFTIKQRIQLLNEGLKDRSEHVHKCVENILLPVWLRYFNGIYADFIKALDPEIGTEVSILTLNAFFKNTELVKLINQLPLDEGTKLIPIDKLTSENSLYWRCLTKHLYSTSHTEALESILPELSTFSVYINEFLTIMSSKQYDTWEKQTHKFILLQLFEIIKTYDLSDEAGRNHLNKLIIKVLESDHCSKEIIECVVTHLEHVVPDVNNRLHALAEVISNIRAPPKVSIEVRKEVSPEEEHENNMRKARIRVKLLELKEEEYEAIQNKEYLKAEGLKENINALNDQLMQLSERLEPDIMVNDDIEEEKSDSETMIKCLTILCSMMRAKSIKALTPTLRCLMNMVLTSLDHPDDRVHVLALEALGISCILDKELAKTHIWTFLLQFSLELEKQEIWIITLKAIFDLLLLFGLEFLGIVKNIDDDDTLDKNKRTEKTKKLYNQTEDEDITMFNQTNKQLQNPDIMKILMSLMDNEDQNLRTVATEGFCKLLVNCRIRNTTLLARIIIMYYNPVNSDNALLCQCISSFFQQFLVKVPSNQEMLEETFLPVLRILSNAPETSPLQEINPYEVASFILNLTRNRESKHNTYCVHNNMAFTILTEILNPQSKIDTDILIKCLRNLDVQIDDNVALDDLKNGVEKVLLMVNSCDKRLICYVETFKRKLDSQNAAEGRAMTEHDINVEE